MNTIGILVIALFITLTYGDHRFEKTHLVTMRKAELMEIVDCISKSKDIILCEKFLECEKMMPKQVFMAYEKCQKECMVGGVKKCNAHEPLFESPEIPAKIFDCIVENTHKLSPEENLEMVNFEKCSRDLFAESCKRPKYHHY